MTASLEERLPETPAPEPAATGLLAPAAAALQFLTVVPPLVRRPFTPAELGRAVGYFALVGALLGAGLAGLDALLGRLFPPLVTAALLLAAWVLATGALHLDGLLDTCDGLFGGRSVEARLRILRDERVGAFAVVGGLLVVLLKFSALAALPARTAALVVAPAVGRWGMSLAIVAFPYARAEGLGRALKDHAGWRELGLASASAGLIAGLVGWRGLLALGLSALAAGAVGWFVLRRLPGFTGDVYGALCEVLEVLVLLVFVAGGGA
jgi:adenosylcobinamide-GDP ribazoletransferase